MTDLANPASEVVRESASLPTTINYNRAIGAIRMAVGRPDQAGWYSYLDNVYIGTVPKPAD
jgi:hypothetical protein